MATEEELEALSRTVANAVVSAISEISDAKLAPIVKRLDALEGAAGANRWAAFTDAELDAIGCWKGYVDGEAGGDGGELEKVLEAEILAELERRRDGR